MSQKRTSSGNTASVTSSPCIPTGTPIRTSHSPYSRRRARIRAHDAPLKRNLCTQFARQKLAQSCFRIPAAVDWRTEIVGDPRRPSGVRRATCAVNSSRSNRQAKEARTHRACLLSVTLVCNSFVGPDEAQRRGWIACVEPARDHRTGPSANPESDRDVLLAIRPLVA